MRRGGRRRDSRAADFLEITNNERHPSMASHAPDHATLVDVHGARELPLVTVEGYSLQLRDQDGFLGDGASQTAFRELLQRARKERPKGTPDPFGRKLSRNFTKKELDAILADDEPPAAAAMLRDVIQTFAIELAHVTRQFLREPSWKGVERVVIGGGFPESDVGERAILQASVILRSQRIHVPLGRLSHEVDDGGLIGWVHLVPPTMLRHHDAILAVDIGGTNLRCGIVKLRRKRAEDLSRAKVLERRKWRHADDKPTRSALVDRLASMLQELVDHCDEEGLSLAPFIGIACPGQIRQDGSIARGTQNLPGDWESDTFHLPSELQKKLPTVGGIPTMVRLHNDAVVQGLSELPLMRDVRRWAILTIGTGLGNVSYANKPEPPEDPEEEARKARKARRKQRETKEKAARRKDKAGKDKAQKMERKAAKARADKAGGA
jgi:hypothetical protein